MKPYTKEPWYSQWADNGNLRIVEQRDEAAIIADVNVERQEITGRPEEEGIANGRRIVACVNACKDISDPETEIAQLRQDKAELLKALEKINGLPLDLARHDSRLQAYVAWGLKVGSIAKTAIAKARP